jgi:hypothetical protein
MRSLKTSITMDSNPDGVNQYSGGGGKHGGNSEAKEAKSTMKDAVKALGGSKEAKQAEHATKDAAKASKDAKGEKGN